MYKAAAPDWPYWMQPVSNRRDRWGYPIAALELQLYPGVDHMHRHLGRVWGGFLSTNGPSGPQPNNHIAVFPWEQKDLNPQKWPYRDRQMSAGNHIAPISESAQKGGCREE